MAARAITAIKNAMSQYSKKMCTRVTIFWMLYRLANFIVVLINPDIAGALVDLSTGVDTIMIVNISTYTGNSVSEKLGLAFSKRRLLYGQNSNTSTDIEDEDENNG